MTTTEDWIRTAREVAAKLAVDAVERDRANETPYQEVQLLKDSGLVTLLGPVEHGGGGQTWETAYRVIREVARGDGSIGQLLGYHYLWAWAARLVATDEQIAVVEELYTRDKLFFGGAVNPRDSDLTITEDGDELVYRGHKSFSTGSKVSDLTVLEGVLEGTGDHVFAIVPSKQEGIVFHDDWDNIGQRLTESGSVTINDVRVPWSSAAGYVDKKFRPLTYNTLNVPTIQLVFTNFYLGIAQGALDTALAYTRDNTRAWPYGGDNKESAGEEWYILDGYGDLQAKLWAAEALTDKVGAEISQVLHAPREELTPEARGEVAVRIAAAKQRVIDTGLEIGTRIFELTGARASATKYGLDLFWRNLRTHSLHDPVAYKRREVGAYALLGQLPEPTWYT
ncbi:alkylation response protein AidB-like acyl-CoA dehydrogenase [Amycolatopsis bartoniae]|uniref:Monooxygenase n=1 Tax=Amycolatopsis bartoniae TaxID=941986 RepID=A0A8H9IZA9_9PSEU|nr:acyl-CoA dehydrogenase family protein [Amycolatopsis bartoniae]MBB2936455.1 alkylation response protein AidB-like acyl-CoA dehydrogenase [Amycolatopsis bartoniae]TVT11059.1 monooxygenase [Amycolatopsis bartoniae]GHF68817.1 monooxygenase [Amycolatopsis bartoniae]